MRLRHNPQARENLNNSKFLLQKYPITLDQETIIEIGMGKGEMLSQLALNNANYKYIGFEKYATVAEKCLKRVLHNETKNLFIVCDDAKNINEIFTGFPHTIWLTFSDPWPKARHEKRRLTYKNFLDQYKKIMDKNTVLKLKTDNDKFFEYSVGSLQENGFTLTNITRDFHSESFSKGNIMTGYEKKWSDKGKKINYLEARK